MSYSQLGQDIWVLDSTNYKTNGYFVDIGANDPININNTYLLENKYNWKGICIEPQPILFKKCRNIRAKSTIVDNSILFSENDKIIDFKICKSNGLSGIVSEFDNIHNRSQYTNIIKMKTITLENILEKYNAPIDIDYISIDTEGSEYEIIKNFDFNKYNVKLFTIEHNFESEKRDNVFKLLSNNNYTRVEQDKQYPYAWKNNEKWRRKNYKKDKLFEDWYIKN